MYRRIQCSNLSRILELSVKFASQIYHENTNKPLDGAYLADYGIDIKTDKAYLSVVIERREGQLQTLMYPKEGRNPQINCHQLCIAPTSGLEKCL